MDVEEDTHALIDVEGDTDGLKGVEQGCRYRLGFPGHSTETHGGWINGVEGVASDVV
jgi:hypothetical protein